MRGLGVRPILASLTRIGGHARPPCKSVHCRVCEDDFPPVSPSQMLMIKTHQRQLCSGTSDGCVGDQDYRHITIMLHADQAWVFYGQPPLIYPRNDVNKHRKQGPLVIVSVNDDKFVLLVYTSWSPAKSTSYSRPAWYAEHLC